MWLPQLGAGGLVPWIAGLAVGGALLALLAAGEPRPTIEPARYYA